MINSQYYCFHSNIITNHLVDERHTDAFHSIILQIYCDMELTEIVTN